MNNILKKTVSAIFAVLICCSVISCTGSNSPEDSTTDGNTAAISSDSGDNTTAEKETLETVAEGTETIMGTFENKYSDYIFYRNALTNTFDRLTNDKKLNVLYFGGSVTYGVGASNADSTSWRGLVGNWLKETFKDAEITNYNSSISGTGSRLGLFRVETDVKKYNPDLIFIEYSINDYYLKEKSAEIMIDNETMIRRLYEINPNMDIVYIYTGNNTTANDRSILHYAAEAQDKICEYYGLNAIAVARALTDRMTDKSSAKSEEWLTYYQDAVHPIDAGYSAYFEVVKEFFIHECALYKGEKASAHNVPDAKTNVMKKYELVLEDNMAQYVSGDWSYNARIQPVNSGLAVYNGGYTAKETGAEFTVTFKGKGLSLFFAGSGVQGLQYSVDSPAWKSVENDGNRPLNLLYDADGEAAEHTVKIRYKTGASTFDLKITGLLIWSE